MQTKLQTLAQELVKCRGALQELEEKYKAEREPYEQAKQVIQERPLATMAKNEVLSTRYEDFTISRKNLLGR